MQSESIESTQTEALPFKNAKTKVKYFPVRCDGALRARPPGGSRGAWGAGRVPAVCEGEYTPECAHVHVHAYVCAHVSVHTHV